MATSLRRKRPTAAAALLWSLLLLLLLLLLSFFSGEQDDFVVVVSGFAPRSTTTRSRSKANNPYRHHRPFTSFASRRLVLLKNPTRTDDEPRMKQKSEDKKQQYKIVDGPDGPFPSYSIQDLIREEHQLHRLNHQLNAETTTTAADRLLRQQDVRTHGLFLDADSTGNLQLSETDAGGSASAVLLRGLDTSRMWDVVRHTDNGAESSSSGSDSSTNSLFLRIRPQQQEGKARSDEPGVVLPVGSLPRNNNNNDDDGERYKTLACARLNQYWMGPAFGGEKNDASGDEIPFDTQFLLVELQPPHDSQDSSEPYYALFLPLLDAGYRASLVQGEDEELRLLIQSENGLGDHECLQQQQQEGSTSSMMRALHVTVSKDPFACLEQGFAEVAAATGTFRTLHQKRIPDNVNHFGWCTWDAFYSKVTPEGVLRGVSTLKEQGIQVRNVILDDGWQQVDPPPAEWEEGGKEGGANNDDPPYSETTTNGGVVPVASADSLRDTVWLAVSALVFNTAARIICALYDRFVQGAPHTAVAHRIFRAATHGMLNPAMREFFHSTTDFARQLDGFEPNDKFTTTTTIATSSSGTNGLKGMVSSLKDDLGVTSVYCWHALHGYWRGVSPQLGALVGLDVTTVHPRPNPNLLRIDPQLAWCPVALFGVGLLSSATDLERFYRHLHEPLVEAGIDGVKVDVQSGVSAVGTSGVGVEDAQPLARLYTTAMEASVAKHFPAPVENDGVATGAAAAAAVNCINCMCHSTENLYQYKQTAVARASEDFFPDRQDSQTVHLINVAYNSLFLGQVCLPDWDMFHSDHPQAALHAAARAVGGCPVYVSDQPDRHDAALLRKLVLPDGSILRAQHPGRPTRDCLFRSVGTDGTTALKIWNTNTNDEKNGGNGNGAVGAFHVQGVEWNFDTHQNQVIDEAPEPVTATVRPSDVEPFRDVSGPFVAWGHQSGRLHWLETKDAEVSVPLQHQEWEIFTIVPVQQQQKSIKRSGDDNDGNIISWAPIGLSNMLNSGGAIVREGTMDRIPKQGNDENNIVDPFSTRAQVQTRGPGRFVSYCDPAPDRVLIRRGDGMITDVLFSYQSGNGELSFDLPPERGGMPHEVTIVWD